jgi:2-polyprenyl-3-methyl-5-hydroxy-6-metoxy-1,4-benzoquinol methylase
MDRLAYILEDQERMSLAKNYFAWQSSLVLPELGRRVLEIGCGIGNFTGSLLDREAVIAIDIEAGCIESLKRRYPNHANIHAMVRDASAGLEDLKPYRVDSAVCLNVLEHIEADVKTLRGIASVLIPSGVVALIVPAFQCLYGPIDRNLGHYRRYTRASLERTAQAAGLTVRKSRYMNLAGFPGWWINSHVLRREAQSAGQIEIFDRRIVPLMSRVERKITPPFGQSLFCVLQKVH